MSDGSAVELIAFTRHYRENVNRIHAYCLRRLDPSDAQDATAEVFSVMWRRWADRPPDREVIPWMFGIARNVVSNRTRSNRRRLRLAYKVNATSATSEPGPEDAVVLQSEHQTVLEALAKLSSIDQETIRLVEREQLDRDQVAAVFNVSRTAIDKRISWAYRQLRRLLADGDTIPRHKRSPQRTDR